MSGPLTLAAAVLPLGLDTLAVSAALGVAGTSGRDRLRITALFTGFEAGMPLVGLFAGGAVGRRLGALAAWVGIAVLVSVGLWMLAERGGGEEGAAPPLAGPAAFLLGLSVSADELAIGFSLGVLGVPTLAAVVLIALQALVVTQVGLRAGARLGERVREGAERVAGLALLVLAAYLVVVQVGVGGRPA
ncbi:MAG: manganese efflux pump MntP family protein [Candidatus Dormibacterales bacterium]